MTLMGAGTPGTNDIALQLRLQMALRATAAQARSARLERVLAQTIDNELVHQMMSELATQALRWAEPRVYQGKNENSRPTAPDATMTISPVVSLDLTDSAMRYPLCADRAGGTVNHLVELA